MDGMDAVDNTILAGFGYVLLQARAQFAWVNDTVSLGAGLVLAAYMVVFTHHGDWSGHGGFFGDTPIFVRLLAQHAAAVFATLWTLEKGSHLASGVPVLNQVFPKFNQRTNGATPPAATTQGGK